MTKPSVVLGAFLLSTQLCVAQNPPTPVPPAAKQSSSTIDGKLTLTVPTNWTVVIRFTNKDPNLPHSAEVVDTAKPMPAGPVEPPALPRAETRRLMQGLGAGEADSMQFVATKPGAYMIFCGVPGHGLAGMWVRFKVSATEKRPTLTTTSS